MRRRARSDLGKHDSSDSEPYSVNVFSDATIVLDGPRGVAKCGDVNGNREDRSGHG